jgi:hypothetical protein
VKLRRSAAMIFSFTAPLSAFALPLPLIFFMPMAKLGTT